MSEPSPDQDPKLIIDEDWKEQVQKEKDALRAAAAASEKGSEPDTEPATEAIDQGPPPASFVTLVSMLFTQAMAMLGQIAEPEDGPPTVNKKFAKHYIDTLEMLEQKTKGNLEKDEKEMLAEALHALRMTFVSVKAR